MSYVMRQIHDDEMNDYLDQMAEERYERIQSRKRIVTHPHDPDFIADEEEDEIHVYAAY